ncbi:nuclear transport factor 2 [Aspergillus niger]|nr:nuclear transport factor 2 [Aspergillus niger]
MAEQFVQFYYQTFDSDRQQLAGLYRDTSMLTFEDASMMGVAPIMDKLMGLAFQKVQHQISTLDAQPSVNNSIIVMVTGALLVDDEQRPMNYTQTFTLNPEGGSYYVFNDIFRLIMG